MKRSAVSTAGADCISGEDEEEEVMFEYEGKEKESLGAGASDDLCTTRSVE